MTRKSLIEREKKTRLLVAKYALKRAALKKRLKESNSKEVILKIKAQLQKMPKKSAPTILHNRCLITGRSRGYFRDFQISRFIFRSLALSGALPGIIKASW